MTWHAARILNIVVNKVEDMVIDELKPPNGERNTDLIEISMRDWRQRVYIFTYTGIWIVMQSTLKVGILLCILNELFNDVECSNKVCFITTEPVP